MTSLLKPAVLVAVVLPGAWTALELGRGTLGVNPVEKLINRTGFTALSLLLITLLPTALKIATGVKWPLKVRRMLGLSVFAYATVHLGLYAVLDRDLDPAEMLDDVLKRKFMAVGFAAWLVMLPLAITSTPGWVRRLGGRRWQALHRLVYAAALLAVVHHTWKVKADLTWPVTMGALLAVLLGVRVVDRVRRAR